MAACLIGAPAAFGAPAVSGEFPLPASQTVGSNNEIVQGPDGNMWVTTETNTVVRIQPDGSMQAFPTTNTPFGITVGPDNNLWVTTAVGVAKIDPATGAELDTYDVDFAVAGAGITVGPDGKLWATAGDELVSFSAADPENTDVDSTIIGMQGKGMATGSDGLLWIADGSGFVHSATAANTPTITTYTTGGGPQDVAAGPNTQVAYANPGTNPQTVGRITPGGAPLVTDLGPTDPFGAAFGQDGAYWIARSNTNDLLRLTPEGATSTLSGFAPSGGVGPRKVATGPNGTLWVTLDTPEAIGRVSGVEVEPPPTPPGALEPDTQIDKAPKKKVKTKKARAKVKFKFSSPTAGASFECSLKGKPKGGKRKKGKFKPCESPKKYRLKPGKYTFKVRASAAGIVDQTPAKHKFKVVAA